MNGKNKWKGGGQWHEGERKREDDAGQSGSRGGRKKQKEIVGDKEDHSTDHLAKAHSPTSSCPVAKPASSERLYVCSAVLILSQ